MEYMVHICCNKGENREVRIEAVSAEEARKKGETYCGDGRDSKY